MALAPLGPVELAAALVDDRVALRVLTLSLDDVARVRELQGQPRAAADERRPGALDPGVNALLRLRDRLGDDAPAVLHGHAPPACIRVGDRLHLVNEPRCVDLLDER